MGKLRMSDSVPRITLRTGHHSTHEANLPLRGDCDVADVRATVAKLPIGEKLPPSPALVRPKSPSDLRAIHNKTVLFLYRSFALVTLYGVLALVFGYAFFMVFYAVNSSWLAPIIVSQSNDSILAMTSQLVSSKQLLDSLTLDRNRLQESIGIMQVQRTELVDLDKQLAPAIAQEKASNKVNGVDLNVLLERKKADNERTQGVLNDVDTLIQQLDRDLAAGLITKGDAATQRVALTQFKNTDTDNNVGAVLLRDNVRQKTAASTEFLSLLGQRATLQAQISQLDINISIGEQQLKTDQDQIEGVTRAVETLKRSPFYLVTQSPTEVKFAFVPYNNEAYAKVGAPVYDCYLNMILCRQVATVKTLFTDEQKAIHPIFKTDLRGFFVQLDMTEPQSAKSKTLFLGHKPLFF
jgi:hypothetical protein